MSTSSYTLNGIRRGRKNRLPISDETLDKAHATGPTFIFSNLMEYEKKKKKQETKLPTV